MEKIYCDCVLNPINEDVNQFLLNLISSYREAKEKFNEYDLKIYCLTIHKTMRERFEMPNKLFAFVKNADNTKAQIVCFPKEPDGNIYQPFYDEELNNFYILVDHIKE